MHCISFFLHYPPLIQILQLKSESERVTQSWLNIINCYLKEEYMIRIISKIWSAKKNAPKLHIAYAISICEFILNPSNLRIQVSEASIKSQITKYLQRISNKEKLSSNIDESDNNNGTKSLEILECNEGSEVLGGRDHEVIRDKQEVEDCEIQHDDNVNIESDDYLSST